MKSKHLIGIFLIILSLMLLLQPVFSWRFNYITIAKKDEYGRYKMLFGSLIDTSNSTISTDLQKLVEGKCNLDRAIVFGIDYGRDEERIYVKGLYDPNGVLYAKGITAYYDTEYTVQGKKVEKRVYRPAVPCPDRNRPGYWTIVFSDGSEVTFYVPPKTKGLSIQAICGPGILAFLTLLPIGILRRRRQ